MKTILFGGSFNPIHVGHLCMAEEALASTGADKVLFIPARIPPHKELKDPGPEFRLSMLHAALEGFPMFSVEDCEIQREGTSYTIDTIRELVGKSVVEPMPILLIGDDLLSGFYSWKEWEAILHEARILVARRMESQPPAPQFPCEKIDNIRIPISSSLVRARIGAQGAWRSLVPSATARIIEKHGLYGFLER
ncbi:MAG TPA: nicotinate (nicotinamide) nucleotide adenylyltransferase [Rectinemataceae bacterium]